MSPDRASASAARVAIGQAARQLGLPDPVAIGEELLAVDVDALREWFAVAARTRVRLFQGAGRLSDALPMIAAGWSNPAPRMIVAEHRGAGLASREVVGAQVDAADEAGAVLRQSRMQADAELSQAEASIIAMGHPPGADLLFWAAASGQLAPAAGMVAELSARLEELRTRNTEALHALAVALRADPGDPVQGLAHGAGVAPAAVTTRSPTGSGPGPISQGPISQGPISQGPASPGTANPGAGGFDKVNRDRLAADLHSTDVAILTMALGVTAALEKASTQGGVAQLLVYESAGSGGQGRAAISVGDITTADNVATLAPGVSNAPVSMADGIGGAVALRDRAQQQSPGDRTAVVAWYGYDIPLSAVGGVPVDPVSAIENTAAALNDTHARAGGALLADDLAQFRQWAPDTARFIGIGFSMGSTTVSAAAARGARFDDLVLLGSPGASVDVQTADDYPNVAPDHTFVAAFDQDPITTTQTDLLAGLMGGGLLACAIPQPTPLSPFGPDPAAGDFGAQVIDVESNNPDMSVTVDVGLGGPLGDFIASQLADDVLALALHHQEANYLSGESLQAVASVVVGRYGEVPIKPGR